MATAGELIRLALAYSMPNSSQVLNVFLWQLEDFAADEDVVSDLEDWVATEWGAVWETAAAAQAAIVGGEIDVINPDGTVARNIGSFLEPIVGNVGGQIMNAATSAYIKADTTIPKTRGSKYIPGFTESDSDEGKWDAGILAVLVDLLAIYVATHVGGVSGAEYLPGVLSRLTETFIEFNGAGYVTDIPAYQRRRKPGVGS